MIQIVDRAEYDYIVSRGFKPLQDWRKFQMSIALRQSIQFEMFGHGNFQTANDRFYHYCWDNMPHFCSETGQPLHNYSAVYISHIISRGSNRAMAIDPRNINILSFKAHQKWENGNRKEMNIYPSNQLIIRLLKRDYNF